MLGNDIIEHFEDLNVFLASPDGEGKSCPILTNPEGFLKHVQIIVYQHQREAS
jgi:hypothetical protein